MYKAVFLAVVIAAPGAAAARPPQPEPGNPKAKVPPVEYRSAFDGYRRFTGEDVSDWRKSNEEVGAAGARTSKPQPGESNK